MCPAAFWFHIIKQPHYYSGLKAGKSQNSWFVLFCFSPSPQCMKGLLDLTNLSNLHRCHFATFKQCQEWVKRLNRAIAHPSRLEDLFALAYHAWCLGGSADDEDQHLHLCRPGSHTFVHSFRTSKCLRGHFSFISSHHVLCVFVGDHVRQRMEMEVKRMGFDTQNIWRVSDINCNYKYVTDA